MNPKHFGIDNDWEVRETCNSTVILPRNDIQAHIAESIYCPCKPEIAIYNPFFDILQTPFIAHYSFKQNKRVDEALKELFNKT